MASYPNVAIDFFLVLTLRDRTRTALQKAPFRSISGSGAGSLPSIRDRVTLADGDPYEARGHIVDPFARSDPQQIDPHLLQEPLGPGVYGAVYVAVESY